MRNQTPLSYDHLATVFQQACSQGRSTADALRALDEYRLERAATNVVVDSFRVVTLAAKAFGVAPRRVLDGDRHRAVCNARWVAAKVLSVRGWSSVQIGDVLGLDHSSVLHALKMIDRRPELVTEAEAVLASVEPERQAA